MRMCAWLLIAALSGSSARAQGGWQWHETTTPHFSVHHQSVWLPEGLTMGLEKINFRLHMDLGIFSNWSSSGRVAVYIYKNQQAYAGGRFHPPSWSNGVAIYDKKAVAIPAMHSRAQMLRVLAHENTHLIFVNYFRESHRDPPAWVNEGLAMLEEADSPERPQTSVWYQNMVEMNPQRWFPLEKFFAISPTTDLVNDPNLVTIFYVQAYSLTHFLMRKHTKMQFKSFCDHLRAGDSVADSLRLAYQYETVGDFERAWRRWLALPEHLRRVQELPLADRDQDTAVDQAGVANDGSGGFSEHSAGFGSGFSVWKVREPNAFGRPLPMPTFAPQAPSTQSNP